MIRAILNSFVASLILITWADDVYLGSQTIADSSDECCSVDNDNFLPCEVRQSLLVRIIIDGPLSHSQFDWSKTEVLSFFHQLFVTSLKPRWGLSLYYMFMSLLY
jgi:hypothetical protein